MKRQQVGVMVGLATLTLVMPAAAQTRPSGQYTQTIGPGALTPNGRVATGSYGYGYGYGYRYAPALAYGGGYGGRGIAYGTSYGSAYGITTARPSNVTWYSVAGGYSSGPQTGVPWRGGGPRSSGGNGVIPESPVEGLARNRTVTGRDYALSTKLARMRLAAEKSPESTAVPVSSRRVESTDKKAEAPEPK